MNVLLEEEQIMLQRMARDFLERECPMTLVRELEDSGKGFSPELWGKMAELGWLGMVYPEEYGGTASSLLNLAVVYEEIGRALLPSPHLTSVVLSGLTILAAGSEEQKNEFLPKIAKGELIFTLALTEPGGDWDPESVTVNAVPERDEYVISGTKLYVREADSADYLLCVTRTRNGAAPEEGITLFIVDAKSPGVSLTLLNTLARSKQFEVAFDKVRVPGRNMVGDLHGGWAPLSKVLQQGAVLQSAELVGNGQKVTELTVDYAKTRVQYGTIIGVNQSMQWQCVDMSLWVSRARDLALPTAAKLSQGIPCALDVALAKAYASDYMPEVGYYGMRIFAGIACTLDHDLQMYIRRAMEGALNLGDGPFHRRVVARQMAL